MPEFVKADGGPIAYDLRGPVGGDPVLLIEGLSAHLLGWRDEFCQPFVDAGYRVIRLDNRDVGLSAHYPNTSYDITDMADDVHQLIQHLDAGPVHVVGQSMGGVIAQQLALDHPEHVASVTLLYTTGSPRLLEVGTQGPPAHASSREEAIELHIARERECASRDYSFDEAWKRHLGGLMYDRCYDPDGIGRQLDALLRSSVRSDGLAGSNIRVLIIHGTADKVVPSTASVQLHHALPGSDLWLVEGMGHDLPRELWAQLIDRMIKHGPGFDRAMAPAAQMHPTC